MRVETKVMLMCGMTILLVTGFFWIVVQPPNEKKSIVLEGKTRTLMTDQLRDGFYKYTNEEVTCYIYESFRSSAMQCFKK